MILERFVLYISLVAKSSKNGNVTFEYGTRSERQLSLIFTDGFLSKSMFRDEEPFEIFKERRLFLASASHVKH